MADEHDELRDELETDAAIDLELDNALDELSGILQRCQTGGDDDDPSYVPTLDEHYTTLGLEDLLKRVSSVWFELGELMTDVQAMLRAIHGDPPPKETPL